MKVHNLLAAAFLLAGVGAAAAEDLGQPTRTPSAHTLRVQNVDLNNPADRQRVLAAVEAVSSLVCRDHMERAEDGMRTTCERHVRRDVTRRLDAPVREAVRQAKLERN